ncbi:MAG TPA: ComEC/Rec2 family competence protein [Homoserinimonas sp.]|nr:ComEC/Rec2 family competence protein [Homoserinimonas sp.]
MLAVAIGAPSTLPWVAAGCWLLAVALLAVARVLPARFHVLTLAAALCSTLAALMLTSAAMSAPNRWPEPLVDAASTGAVVRALASTTQVVHAGDGRFTATITGGTVAGRDFEASVPVLAFGAVEKPIGIGAEVRLVGTLGEADRGGNVAFLFFLADDASVERGPPWLLETTGDLRDGFRDVATSLPGDGGDLLPGLAIGDTSAVADTLDTAMKASSLSHLTAVSGANCAVIIALVIFGGAALGLPRAVRIGAALAVLAGFVVLVTPEPSVLRASVMAALVLAGVASGRPLRGLPVLGLAVTVLLVIDPWLARNFGFVLSVCATAGLLLLATPLARALSRWMPLPLALLVAVPAAAQLACQPVLILLTPSIPTYGVLANILAAPAAPVATVLGLVACIVIPVMPAFGTLIAQVAWLPSAWIAAVASFFSSLPGASLPWLSGLWGVALALLIGGLALLAWLLPVGRTWRRAASVGLLLVIVAYAGAAGGEQLRRRLSPPSDWVVAACDVGQGDAMLVRNSGLVALIDTGPDSALLDYCLSTLGVAHIDLLVLTHFDLDHVGGSSAVAGRVDRLLVGPSAGQDDDRVVQQLADAGAAVEQVARGDSGELGGLGWRVLWPPPRLGGIEPGNDASVVVEFTPIAECGDGCLSGVFLGDLGEESQGRMLAAASLGRVDLVKVSHHGSRDQDSRLYERLRATVGLIGVGADNDYGHPTAQTLDLLGATGTEVVRTDRSGLALLSLRDGELHLWTERTGVGAPE